MTFHIFLQARQNSTRFPNKILKEICGKSVFELIIERLQNINNAKIFLVTGPLIHNKQLIEKSIECGIEYFTGNENNVLDRFYQASKKFESEKIIRITGDCPLLDFKLINNTKIIFEEDNFDLVCNYLPRSYPHGYDFEIFSSKILEAVWKYVFNTFSTKQDFEKEKIPPMKYIINSKSLSIHNIKNSSDFSFIRLTLDYPEDFELITKIYENLYQQNYNFDSEKIISLIRKNPKLLNLNENHVKFNKSKLRNFFVS